MDYYKNEPEYFFDWLANIVQLNEKSQVAVLLKSTDQGVGKTTFFTWFGKLILGERYFHFVEKNEMLSNFNSPLENKLLIYIAEASGTVNHSFQKTFESLISDDYLTIEKKGIDPYSINNNLNFALSTNTSNPVKIDMDDRKWNVYDSDKCSPKDFEFINMVKEDMKNPIVIK